MSQTVKFVRIEDVLYPEVLRGFPDKDEAIAMIQEMIKNNLISVNTGWYDVVSRWYEIGDGESGMDTFFTDEELLKWEENGEFIKLVEAAGKYAEHIETQSVSVDVQEVHEDYDEDIELDCDGECVGCDRACADRISAE